MMLNNSVILESLIFSVPKSSIINKSTFNMFSNKFDLDSSLPNFASFLMSEYNNSDLELCSRVRCEDFHNVLVQS